jgi:hypothetical protein
MSDGFVDPFRVRGKIPKGKIYQWVVLDIPAFRCSPEGMLKRGWKYVPAKRHPRMRHNKKGQIVVGKCVLMELSRSAYDERRQKEIDFAASILREGEPRQSHISSAVLTAYDWTPEKLAEEKAKLSQTLDGQPYVTVCISMTVSDYEIETAVGVLKLDPEEYMRRRVIMDTEVLMRRSGPWGARMRDHVLFSRAEISVTPKKDAIS